MNMRTRKTAQGPLEPAGFTLIELLSVITIISLLATFSGPALRALTGAGTTDRAVADLSQTLELARVYAMANHTYVRVAIGTLPTASGRTLPATVVLAISSADGTLKADGATDMADGAKWRALNRPLVLDNLLVYDALNAASPATQDDATPSDSDIASFSRNLGSLSTVTFDAFIQFSPSGEGRVEKEDPARFIKVACDQPLNPGATGSPRNENPFILRMSGINGHVNILRKEDL